jgi:hypothetical protein
MIVTSLKPYGVIEGWLQEGDRVGVVSCNSCARVCETGGRIGMDEMAVRLRDDGFSVVDEDLLPMCCNLDTVSKAEYAGDVLVVLACDSGVYTLEKLYPEKKVIAALNTIGLGARGASGIIYMMKQF